MTNLFEEYQKNVSEIYSLPHGKHSNDLKNPKKVRGWSIRRLLLLHLKSIIRFIVIYPIEFLKSGKLIFATARAKNLGKNKKAIVMGNGPSKGFLSVKLLDDFVNSGGETFAVNNWASDIGFNKHVPTWMVFSDPATFDSRNPGAPELISFLKGNPEIKIAIPASLHKHISSNKITNEVYSFIDTECSFSRNIHPLFPRGYLSMTLYKALALANYMNFEYIGVIGMDNTYVRSLYSNEKNEVLEVQEHSGGKRWVKNASNYYFNMAARLDDVTRLFNDLDYFPKKKIFNLDKYSLTDRFDKVDIIKFLNL